MRFDPNSCLVALLPIFIGSPVQEPKEPALFSELSHTSWLTKKSRNAHHYSSAAAHVFSMGSQWTEMAMAESYFCVQSTIFV